MQNEFLSNLSNRPNRRRFMAASLSGLSLAFFGGSNSGWARANDGDSPTPEASQALSGVISVLVTPYRGDRSVAPSAVESLCGRVSQAGANGVFIAGSTGDMGLLPIAEREIILTAVRKAITSEKKICVGVSDYSIDGIVENTKRFAERGADIAVLMPPMMFFKFSQAELTEYFRLIADKSPLPILLYHHVRVSTPIELETILAVADHPNIIGMKETGANFERTLQILEAVKGKNFLFMQGNEPYVIDSYKAGCNGVLSALAGVWPELFVPLDRIRLGDDSGFDGAAAKLTEMCELFKIMPSARSFSYFGWTMKRMLNYRGWLDSLAVRMPGFEVDPQWDQQLVAFLEEREFPKS